MALRYILGIAVVFGSAILFHEFGHFIVARFFGVRVNVFSLGFGPKLFGWKGKETDYRVSLLPLGGYIKMEGEDAEEKISDPTRSFCGKSRWKRICIVLAGPLANVILAVVVLAGVYAVRFEEPAFLEESPRIGYVTPESIASREGIKKHDVIVAVAGKKVGTWREAYTEIGLSLGRTIRIGFRRDGKILTAQLDLRGLNPGKLSDFESIGLVPAEQVIVDSFYGHSPARDAGLKIGDEIIEVGGRKILSFAEFVAVLQEASGRQVDILVRRDDGMMRFTVTPVFDKERKRWLTGATIVTRTVKKKLSPAAAIKVSLERNKEIVVLTARGIFGMALGTTSTKSVSGPIGVAYVAGESAQADPASLFQFIALISISLGFLNLLPIMPLDGGHVAVLVVESAIGRDLNPALKLFIQTFGLILILILFCIGIWNDASRLLGH